MTVSLPMPLPAPVADTASVEVAIVVVVSRSTGGRRSVVRAVLVGRGIRGSITRNVRISGISWNSNGNRVGNRGVCGYRSSGSRLRVSPRISGSYFGSFPVVVAGVGIFE